MANHNHAAAFTSENRSPRAMKEKRANLVRRIFAPEPARIIHDGSTEQRQFTTVQRCRMLLVTCLILFLAQLLDFGVSPLGIVGSFILGTAFAGTLLRRGLLFAPILLLHIFAIVLGILALQLLDSYIAGGSARPTMDFVVARFADTLNILLWSYVIGFCSAWFFWTNKASSAIEAVTITLAFVGLLSAHRNYHVDAPKQFSSLSWKLDLFQRLHIEPYHITISLAVLFVSLLLPYLYFAHSRPIFQSSREVYSIERGSRILRFTIPILAILVLTLYALELAKRYESDLNRATEGVGQSTQEGQSNLGFHSAIGQTRQPAALVRLEGDYGANPWAPMLYLREGALSEYNGHELVAASSAFDQDVPRIAPGQPYISVMPKAGLERTHLVQTIFLIAKHNTPFAIDYPLRLGLVKNPNPKKYTLAYQAISEAPVMKVDDMGERPVGDSSWDEATRNHYLRSPGSRTSEEQVEGVDPAHSTPVADIYGEDLRYRALAKKLTIGIDGPIAKAKAIIRYLSENSIYTRNPGHTAGQSDDPVAPYLFSEKKRGYCVHFAHAAVYMMREVGIPARIATGYLTDLTFAKDGHILLQMSDRHAWPEMFIEGYGWTVLDITPAQAENEQVVPPDEKLLEELMASIDPSEELQPTETQERSVDEQKGESIVDEIVNRKVLIPLLLCIILCWIGLKLWLRQAYRLPA